jgi:hypothetical protein
MDVYVWVLSVPKIPFSRGTLSKNKIDYKEFTSILLDVRNSRQFMMGSEHIHLILIG